MSDHETLLAHRARLLERAEFERAELAGLLNEWETPLRAVDRSVSIFRALRGSPLLRVVAGAGMAALAVARPRSVMGWVLGGRAIWQLVKDRTRHP